MKDNAPSFSQLLKLYTVYNLGGKKLTGALSFTLFIDKVLSSKFSTTKNYTSLSGFWGYIAYKAICQLKDSDKIDAKYKPILYLLFSGISAGMVVLGKDIFADKHNANKMLKSIALTSFF